MAKAYQEEEFLHSMEAGEPQHSAELTHLGVSCVAFGEPRAHEQEKDMSQHNSGAGGTQRGTLGPLEQGSQMHSVTSYKSRDL